MVNTIRADRQTNGNITDGLEINSCIYGPVIFDKGAKNIPWGKGSLSTNGAVKTGYAHAKNEAGSL